VEFTAGALALFGLAASGFAAWYWYYASKVAMAPTWARGEHVFEPVIRELAFGGEIAGLAQGASESTRLNKIAALWTGLSVLLNALSGVIGSLE
jgi:hypothetical protein